MTDVQGNIAQVVTTDVFSVTPGTYMRHLCAIFAADKWLWLAAPLAVCVVLAFGVDVRFAIVALMVLFVVLPMVLALLYFWYGFAPEARWSIMDKTASFNKEGIHLDFLDKRMKKHTIAWGEVCDIIEKKDAVLLMLKGKRYVCLMLPVSVVNPDVAQWLGQLVNKAH